MILVDNRQTLLDLPFSSLEKMIHGILDEWGIVGAQISLVFCDDHWIHNLNRRTFGRDRPTNVISFPQEAIVPGTDGKLILPDYLTGQKEWPLGDVVVNVERAISDAKEAEIDPLSEVAFLIIHGLCHLVGYDHEGDHAFMAEQMEAEERRLHEKFGPLLLSIT